MPHMTWDLWIFAALVAGALLTGRQRIAKMIAALALLAGIGIGGYTDWGAQVWPAIGDLVSIVS